MHNLYMVGIFLSEEEDNYSWDGNTLEGQVSVEEAYFHITHAPPHLMSKRWFTNIWSWNIPLKLKCFGWLAWHKKILT